MIFVFIPLVSAFVQFVAATTANLTVPTFTNCGDLVKLTCSSTQDCNSGYTFLRNNSVIYTNAGPFLDIDSLRFFSTLISNKTVELTITNIQLQDNGSYKCTCGFDDPSAEQKLQYECKANMSRTEITFIKKLVITVDNLYPKPSSIKSTLTSSTDQLPGSHDCKYSPTSSSHFMCTWVSDASLPDGNYGYTTTVTSGTQVARVNGSIRIVTPTSPPISNLVTISSNRLALRGVEGTPLTIHCVSSGGIPAPTLAWYRGNTSTSPLAKSIISDSVQQSDGTYTVTLAYNITPRRADDLTTFLCRVFYPGATKEASPDPSPSSAVLFLYLRPNGLRVLQTDEAESGGNMTLQCTSSNGRPAPNITWFFKDQSFTPTNSMKLEPTSETYTVVSVLQRPVNAVDNRQTATCMVSHKTLSAPQNGTVQVDVKFGPSTGATTISGNQSTSATGTNQIRLNCTSGSSNPASNITWYNGSDVIQNAAKYTRWSGDNSGVVTSSILTITPTRYMDGDNITCRPDNGYGFGSSHVSLDIRYSPLIHSLTNITAIEGEPDVTLKCSVSSKPPANFTWYKGAKVLTNGSGTLTDNSFSYVIPRVERTDAGSYTCYASNSVERPDKKDLYVSVKYPPTVTVSTTPFRPYTVTCKAEGYPDSYTYQDWVQIWPGYGPVAMIPFAGTTLTVTKDTYERSGVYVCSASNGVAIYGTLSENIKGNASIFVESPPVITNPSTDGKRVPVAGRLGQNSTIIVKYWSNVGSSSVRCFRFEGGFRSSSPTSSGCFVTETDTDVSLPVYNHTVTETGKLATINIPITSEEDFGVYDVVITNSVHGESALLITVTPQDKNTPPGSSSVALNAGIVASVCTPLLIGGIVFITCKRRKAKRTCAKGNVARQQSTESGTSGSVIECAMYESAGSSNADLYSKPQKSNKRSNVAGLYAVVSKTRKETRTSGRMQTNDTSVYEIPEPVLTEQSYQKKNINKDGLTYADLEFESNPKKSVIHGLDDATPYVQVDFTKAADPLPDSDEEINFEK